MHDVTVTIFSLPERGRTFGSGEGWVAVEREKLSLTLAAHREEGQLENQLHLCLPAAILQ